MATRSGALVLGVATFAASYLYCVAWPAYRWKSRDFPVLIAPKADSNEHVSRRFEPSEISKVLVRENEHRESDDSALVQLHLVLRGKRKPVLVGQSYASKAGRKSVEDLAERIRSWLERSRSVS